MPQKTKGSAGQKNPQGIPQEGHGGKNSRGGSGGGSSQNKNTKGNGAQKRKSEKRR